MKENQIKERINKIKKKIAKHAQKAGREPESIKIIAVSKNQPVNKIESFHNHGFEVFGENRVQELREKYNRLDELDLNWHFIGHLQRNKVKYLLRMNNCVLIQSVDSLRLAREINKRAGKNDRVIPVLVQINISGEDSKFGIKPEESIAFLKEVGQFDNISIRGLMTLAPYFDNPEKTRPYFQEMHDIYCQAKKKGFALKELSMGMSNDFHIAVEEGATMIRIGRALMGPRQRR